jgi:hypothetical protein
MSTKTTVEVVGALKARYEKILTPSAINALDLTNIK